MVKAITTAFPMPYPLSNEQELFVHKWRFRHCFKYDLITKMKDGEEKDKEEKKFWWSIDVDCFTRVFGDETHGYLENMFMDSYPDQVVIKKEENSGDELKEESSSSEEEEDELEEEENEYEDIDNNDNEHSNSYSSALTTMDLGVEISPRLSRGLLDWRQWCFKSHGV